MDEVETWEIYWDRVYEDEYRHRPETDLDRAIVPDYRDEKADYDYHSWKDEQ